jgi:hypothetical protein
MSGTYYRVRVGSFASSRSARAYGEMNLAPAGIDYWADLKGRDTQPVHPVYKPKVLPPAPKPVAPAAATAVPTETQPAPTTPEPAAEPVPAPATQDTKPEQSLPDW